MSSNLIASKTIALYGITIALVASLTAITIPITATMGIFNLGETMIFFAAFMFGRRIAAISGVIGACMIDLILAPHFIPATIVAKAVEGFVAGTIAIYAMNYGSHWSSRTIAFTAGGSLMIVTYFCYVAFVLPLGLYPEEITSSGGLGNALFELPWNILQVLIGGTLAVLLAEGTERAYPRVTNLRE